MRQKETERERERVLLSSCVNLFCLIEDDKNLRAA